MPVEKLWGVGPRTAQRLRAIGIRTIADLAAMPAEYLSAQFGRMGEYLHSRAWGIDDSPVQPDRQRKSISQEHTFERDTLDSATVEDRLLSLSERVAAHLRRGQWQARTFTLKLRYADFTTITRSHTLPKPTDLAEHIHAIAVQLLRRYWKANTAVRLVGIGASNLLAQELVQATFFEPDDARRADLARIVDEIREKYGEGTVRRARMLRVPQSPTEAAD